MNIDFDPSVFILPNVILFLFVFAFGIVIGSFLNVCIYRLPKEESLTKESSHCMSCGEKIKFYDLIPIFSWIFLGGKCRHCKEKISPRYCIVESLSGILWVLSFIQFGFTLHAILCSLLLSALIIVAFMDWDTSEINTGVIVFIGIIGIISTLTGTNLSLFEHLLGLVIISIPFFLIGLITNGIGLGDTLLMAACGLFLGIKAVIVAAAIGILIACIAGILLKIKSKSSRFAFGPWLSAGVAVSMFFGNSIANWYLAFLK